MGERKVQATLLSLKAEIKEFIKLREFRVLEL